MILSLIAEATEGDFKSALERDNPKSWLKSVSAFANGIGGTLFFGVGNDGKPVGLTNAQSDAEYISEKIKTRIAPLPDFVLTPLSEKGLTILVLEIKAGHRTPYYYAPDRGVRQAFVRIGNESVIAPDYILNELILKGTNRTFDTTVTAYKKEDYSFTFLEATYRHRLKIRFESTDYKSFGLETDDGYLTLAGSLLTDQHLVYNARVFCTRWRGLEMGSLEEDALDDSEIEGNIIQLLLEACNFVKRHNQTRFEKAPMERIDKPSYAERAVLEAVVNALIHRNWLMQGAEVHIDMYDDRCEISSPGGMYSGKLIQDLDITKMKSERRNPVLADLFHRMKWMDRRGSGLRKIVNETKKLYGYTDEFRPEFDSTHSSFTVVLKKMNYTETQKQDENFGINFGINETQKKIISLLKENPKITMPTIAGTLDMTKRNVEININLLKKAGLLERAGAKKNGRWVVRNTEG